MIFDDYGLGGPELTQKGIDGFLSGYHKKLQYIWEKGSQVIIQKKKNLSREIDYKCSQWSANRGTDWSAQADLSPSVARCFYTSIVDEI